jgi:hypothetical protein
MLSSNAGTSLARRAGVGGRRPKQKPPAKLPETLQTQPMKITPNSFDQGDRFAIIFGILFLPITLPCMAVYFLIKGVRWFFEKYRASKGYDSYPYGGTCSGDPWDTYSIYR